MSPVLSAAIVDLEAWFSNFRGLTHFGRKPELQRLRPISSKIAQLTESDGYVMESLARLADACQKLILQRQPAGFDEGTEISRGLGDIANLKAQVERLFADDREL